MGTRALHDINLIWFGYIAHLSQRGGGGILLVQMIDRREWGGGQHPVFAL